MKTSLSEFEVIEVKSPAKRFNTELIPSLLK